MDAFTLLKTDHEEAAQMFQQLEATEAKDEALRTQLFGQLQQALEVHTQIEEDIFYPALKQEAETREIVLHAYHEHDEIKDLLEQTAATPVTDEDWSDMLAELKEAVEHHVEEEEGEMFDEARDVLSEQQLNDLGTRMQQEKQRLQTQKAASAG
ncbi:MAG TPA: hemerythrin domain-containing protein [Pyrinomonadaceae bacterium]|jgi:hypothetical protein